MDIWDVRSKPPLCAKDPPTEAFIICDESSSPGPDDYLIYADYPIEAYFKEKTATSKGVGYARNFLSAQLYLKKSILTTKLNYVTRLDTGAA